MAKRLLLILMAGFVVLSLALPAGCTKRTVFKGREGSVTVEQKGKKGKVKVKTGKGEAEIETGAELPKNWPQDMPVYKSAKITGSTSIKGEGNAVTLSLVLETSDSVVQVQKFYQTTLPNEGWDITQTSTTATGEEEAAIFTVAKGKRTGIITIGKPADKEKTELVIQIFSQ